MVDTGSRYGAHIDLCKKKGLECIQILPYNNNGNYLLIRESPALLKNAFLLISALLLDGCAYTVLDTGRLENANSYRTAKTPQIITNLVTFADSVKVFNFEFRCRQIELSTFNNTLSAGNRYGDAMKETCRLTAEDKADVFVALQNTDYLNYDYCPEDPDDKSDVFFYFEIGSFKKGLRWNVSAPFNSNEDRIKELESTIYRIIDSSEVYQYINSYRPPHGVY